MPWRSPSVHRQITSWLDLQLGSQYPLLRGLYGGALLNAVVRGRRGKQKKLLETLWDKAGELFVYSPLLFNNIGKRTTTAGTRGHSTNLNSSFGQPPAYWVDFLSIQYLWICAFSPLYTMDTYA